MPFLFHIETSAEAITSNSPAGLVITSPIDKDVSNHPSRAFSPEDIFAVNCPPQAVFKDRPATRCSSPPSGALRPVLGLQFHLSHRRTGSFFLTGHISPISCASFSPTGSLLATGSSDCNARLWDLFTETPSHVLSGHKGWILCVEWEATERKLATGGHDGYVSSLRRVDSCIH